MAVTRVEMTVYYEDESEAVVLVDQRDHVAFEKTFKMGWGSDPWQAMVTQAMRWTSWHALCRTGVISRTETSFAEWDKKVVSAEPEDDEDVDPGKPEASEAGSSD